MATFANVRIKGPLASINLLVELGFDIRVGSPLLG
jgi:hypothetical protein